MSYADEFDVETKGSPEFTIKDSGERSEFAGGMVRDACADKLDYTSLLFGPMLDRYIAHLTKGREKYPDPEPGVPNWTLAEGVDELNHAKRSLLRHVFQLLRDERDEDHAAAVWFNVNLIEYIRDKQSDDQLSKFHASLAKLPPVTNDDDPEAEGGQPTVAGWIEGETTEVPEGWELSPVSGCIRRKRDGTP